MSTPEDVATLFKKASASFAPIVGAPTDDNVVRLRKSIANVLLSLHVSGGKQCLSGIIVPDSEYQAEHGASFDRMSTPLDDYDPSIPPDAKNNERVKSKRVWAAKLERQRLIRAAEREARNFIIAAVVDTWILTLKSSSTFYNKVTPLTMLEHLADNCGGLDSVDVVALQSGMTGWWSEDPRVPEYINRLEEAQRKASRGRLPITNTWLTAIASSSLLAAGSFPRERKEWDGLATADQMWARWKQTFLKAHTSHEREMRAAGKRGDTFGSANAATELRSEMPSPAGGEVTPSLVEQLESHFENLAAAATTGNAVMEQLVAANATLANKTAASIADIKRMLSGMAGGDSALSATKTKTKTKTSTTPAEVLLLREAIRRHWVPGKFCSTHGHGIAPGHTSETCKRKARGHVDSATRANSAGPGKNINKGWDAFLNEEA